jgi:hypothetical protein
MTEREIAIVRAVVYASLFDYPLTLEQLSESLVEAAATPEDVLQTFVGSAALRRVIEHRDGFFFLTGSAELIAERRRREARSRAFLNRYRPVLRLIGALPFTRLVAVSGSVAHLNLEDGGDLDLFIVTRGRTVWTVTLAAIVATRLLAVRRAICANFIVSDDHLALDQHDLFTANQVIHLKALTDDGVFEDFLAANAFVRRCYPNAAPGSGEFALPAGRVAATIKRRVERLLAPLAPTIEALCRRVYGGHLRRRARSWRSPDDVLLRDDYLKLHTQSHRRSVLNRYEQAVAETLARADAPRARTLAEIA